RSVARLSASVLPPGPDRAVALQRQTVQKSPGNGRHAAEPAHLHGHVAVGVCPVAQLPETVEPPGPDRAVALQRQTVQLASGNGRHAAEPAHLLGHVLPGVCPVARLPATVLPPGPDRAVALQRQTVQLASGNSRHAAEPAHLHGRVAGRVCPVAQFSERVVSPGRYCALTPRRLAQAKQCNDGTRDGPKRLHYGSPLFLSYRRPVTARPRLGGVWLCPIFRSRPTVKGLTSLGLSGYPHSRIEMSRDADAGRRQKYFLLGPSACAQGIAFSQLAAGSQAVGRETCINRADAANSLVLGSEMLV